MIDKEISHLQNVVDFLENLDVNELLKERKRKETFVENESFESCAEKIAASIEFASSVFREISPTGIELVKLIGVGAEDNNHEALISFINKFRAELFDCNEDSHFELINNELLMTLDEFDALSN